MTFLALHYSEAPILEGGVNKYQVLQTFPQKSVIFVER